MTSLKFGVFLPGFLLFCAFLLFTSSEGTSAAFHGLPRPLIVKYDQAAVRRLDEEVKLFCDSWRLAVEANNVNPWKTVPEECSAYVKDYMMGRAYSADLDWVSRETGMYAKNMELGGDGRDAWIFDIDETLLSNLPNYADHGFGSEVFDLEKFDKWVDEASAPVIQPSLKLYKQGYGVGLQGVPADWKK